MPCCVRALFSEVTRPRSGRRWPSRGSSRPRSSNAWTRHNVRGTAMRKWRLRVALGLALAPLLAGTLARAMSLAKTNLVNLIHDADSILIGTVSSVTDGIDERGLP